MRERYYTDEKIAFLREVSKGKHLSDITVEFNKRFEAKKTQKAISSIMKVHGIKSDYKHRNGILLFSSDQVEWIKEEFKKRSVNSFYPDYVAKFGHKHTSCQIQWMIKNNRITSGRNARFESGRRPHNKGVKGWCAGGRSTDTRFKKGQPARNKAPIGTEVMTKDGYINVKVADPSSWRHKHIVEWEKHNGTLPKGHRVSFRDGDRANFEPSNLMLVTPAEMGVMNSSGLGNVEPELKDSALLLARLILKKGSL